MCRHFESEGPSGPRGEPYDTPGWEGCGKEHYPTGNPYRNNEEIHVTCRYCKGTGMRWKVIRYYWDYSRVGKPTHTRMAALKKCSCNNGMVLHPDVCELCLELEVDPPFHGCDESCPDYDPIPEPDWDSMRGGHDDY